MFWAGGDPAETLAELKSLGVKCGQLALPGDLDLNSAGAWRDALQAADFTVYTVFATFTGESYADKPTVVRTVGFIPPATRAEREQRTLDVSDFAAAIGAPAIATHVGCVPEDSTDDNHIAVREMVRRIADHAAANGQTFTLETGQESAPVLLDFLLGVNRPNLGINFDPANMILYGTGDPIEAWHKLAPWVISTHAKDGDWPDRSNPDALGTERPLGQGAVGMDRFVKAVAGAGFRGPLNVERETEDQQQRLREIRDGVALLRSLTAAK